MKQLVSSARLAAYYAKNTEFAKMPFKGTPIRYGQKQPVWSRQQDAEMG